MEIKRFEDLPIWKESRLLAKQIYQLTSLPRFKDFSLRDQMRRAVVSIISNIAEGFERGSNKEFIQFLYVTKGSLGELRAQCCVDYDNGFLEREDFEMLIARCEDLSKQVSNFIAYLRRSPITDLRHKEQ